MRVLHTSDWHLGQQFYEHSRAAEQQAFLAWLVSVLSTEAVDILLVSGDIYHTATPPAQAEQLLYEFVRDAKIACPALHIVIIAGNHDSAARIETAKPLLRHFDTHVIGRFNKAQPDSALIQLDTPNGTAMVLGMPFLRPSDLHCGDGDSHYQQAVAAAYQQALEQYHASPDIPLLVMGHLHAKGGDISQDSERNITIGGYDAINASVFPPEANYVALGHLHKAQRVAKTEHIRYSGTPLPMSFAERHYQHQVLLATFSGAQLHAVKPLYVPRTKGLYLVPEQGAMMLDELCNTLEMLKLDEANAGNYLRLRLDARETDPHFRARIEAAMSHLDVQFCGIERVARQSAESSSAELDEHFTSAAITPAQLLDIAYRQHQQSDALAPESLQQLLAQVITELAEESL
ncbi:exonuclease subunit SbcD [Pseudoalteromonas fenneropenaei]|uniref:Nuclease SbcCD subunit D n=1 Tax=Pseudoalteromonas fenneropenaei TaxID=1737459 RepID=A0ABV7CJ42_9GAMM